MHKPESAIENEKHEILWDFEIQTRSSDKKQKTENLPSGGFCRPSRPSSQKLKNEKRDKYLILLKKI